MHDAAVRDLERRWGLTLVSFVPESLAEPLLRIQDQVGAALEPHDEPPVEFYAADHLHCTHLTLTRSSAGGPVRTSRFVRPGADPQALCDIVAEASAGLGPITVRLDRLVRSGNGIQLDGTCADRGSTAHRSALLRRLNAELPGHVVLGRRPWDTDPARYGSVHLRLGFLKRPVALTLPQVEPVTVTFPDLALVHHRYRSLRPPHAGSVRFPLGGAAPDVPAFGRLNLPD